MPPVIRHEIRYKKKKIHIRLSSHKGNSRMQVSKEKEGSLEAPILYLLLLLRNIKRLKEEIAEKLN